MNMLEIFRDSSDLVEYPADSVIFEEGSTAEFMYVIIQGEITLSLHGKKIGVAAPGAIVGEMALLDSEVRSATGTAISDCVLAKRLRRVDEALTGHVSDDSP